MVENEDDEVRVSPQDARLTSLDERLRRAEQAEDKRRPNSTSSAAAVRSRGMRVAQGLVGMPLGGAIIGWLIDRVVGTAPWVMLVLMFVGFAGAVWDAMKTYGKTAGNDAGNE